MPTSEARIRANQANAAKSTGPRTPEGKAISRVNALKHGLTGQGIALPNEDLGEIERRVVAFHNELQPTGEVGQALVRRAALLSVRLDRCASEETARLSERVRQADADFVAPAGVDASTAAQLRAEARARAMFDPSKEATLARKYEAATERGFYRALKELRQIEQAAQATEPSPDLDSIREALASFSQIDELGEALEAKYLEPHERTPSRPVERFDRGRFADLGAPVDVPITIGRRR